MLMLIRQTPLIINTSQNIINSACWAINMKLIFSIIAAGLMLSGCLGNIEPADLAVASYPAYFVANSLAGEDLSIADLASSGEIHDFDPSARDLNQLRSSTHLVLWDEGIESWAHRAEEALGSSAPNVIEITALPNGEAFLEGEADAEGSDEDGHGHGDLSHDPHTWNDPLAMRASVGVLEDYLINAYPEHAENIQTRAGTLTDRLTDLHAEFTSGLSNCARDTIVTNHEAYNYMAHRYNFNIFALHGMEPGSEPSPQTVNEAIQKIKDLNIPAIFIEEGTDPGTLKAIQDETGVQIRVLTTNEMRPQSGDYVESQYQNIQELRFALGCA